MDPTRTTLMRSESVELEPIRQSAEATRQKSQLKVSERPAEAADKIWMRVQTANVVREIVKIEVRSDPLSTRFLMKANIGGVETSCRQLVSKPAHSDEADKT